PGPGNSLASTVSSPPTLARTTTNFIFGASVSSANITATLENVNFFQGIVGLSVSPQNVILSIPVQTKILSSSGLPVSLSALTATATASVQPLSSFNF